MNLDSHYFALQLSSKRSDLLKRTYNNKVDAYFNSTPDPEEEVQLNKLLETEKPVLQARSITNEYFKNVSRQRAIELLKDMHDYAFIIRPSSKGSDFLSVVLRVKTYLKIKISEDLFADYSVREDQKNPADKLEIGKKLYLGNDYFTSLDELASRGLGKIIQYYFELKDHKYYVDGTRVLVQIIDRKK